MISLRAPQGLVVGRADSVRGRKIDFWLDVPLILGARLEFRLELPGADDTVLGWLGIDGGQEASHRKGQAHYQAHVDTIDKGDLKPFERWLHDTELGRVPQDLRGNILERNALAQQQAEEEARQEAEEQARIEARCARLERRAKPVEDLAEPLFFHDILSSTIRIPQTSPSNRAARLSGAKLSSIGWWQDSDANRNVRKNSHEKALQRQQQLQGLLEAVEGPRPNLPPLRSQPHLCLSLCQYPKHQYPKHRHLTHLRSPWTCWAAVPTPRSPSAGHRFRNFVPRPWATCWPAFCD